VGFSTLYTILTLHAIFIFYPILNSSLSILMSYFLFSLLAISKAYWFYLFLICLSTPFNNSDLTIYLLLAITAYINGVNPSLFC